MSVQHFLNPSRRFGELAAQRTFFWRCFALTLVIYLCL